MKINTTLILQLLLTLLVVYLIPLNFYARNPNHIVVFKPKEISDVLTNPGMGFMTFQRFNGDELNEGKNEDGWYSLGKINIVR